MSDNFLCHEQLLTLKDYFYDQIDFIKREIAALSRKYDYNETLHHPSVTACNQLANMGRLRACIDEKVAIRDFLQEELKRINRMISAIRRPTASTIVDNIKEKVMKGEVQIDEKALESLRQDKTKIEHYENMIKVIWKEIMPLDLSNFREDHIFKKAIIDEIEALSQRLKKLQSLQEIHNMKMDVIKKRIDKNK